MLADTIHSDLITALKAHDDVRAGVLRMIIAQFQSREIEKRGSGDSSGLTEEDAVTVLRREVKKRKEASALYRSGNRPELADKEDAECAIIEAYLPAQLAESDVRIVVERCAKAGGDFASVMRAAMQELKGKTDGALVSRLVKEVLGS